MGGRKLEGHSGDVVGDYSHKEFGNNLESKTAGVYLFCILQTDEVPWPHCV